MDHPGEYITQDDVDIYRWYLRPMWTCCGFPNRSDLHIDSDSSPYKEYSSSK